MSKLTINELPVVCPTTKKYGTVEMTTESIEIVKPGPRPIECKNAYIRGFGFYIEVKEAVYITDHLYKQTCYTEIYFDTAIKDHKRFVRDWQEGISSCFKVPFEVIDALENYKLNVKFHGMDYETFNGHPFVKEMLGEYRRKYGEGRVSFSTGGPWAKIRVLELLGSAHVHTPSKGQYNFTTVIGENTEVDVFYVHQPEEHDTDSHQDWIVEEVFLHGTEDEISDLLNDGVMESLAVSAAEHYRDLPVEEDDH